MIEIPGGYFGPGAGGWLDGRGATFSDEEDAIALPPELEISGVGAAKMAGNGGVGGAGSGRSSGVVFVTKATDPRSELTWLEVIPKRKK